MISTSLPLTFDPSVGRKLGKYEVLCRLSTGGMSEIFLGFQRGIAGFRKPVVLKRILPDIQAEESFVKMFLDEAQITAGLNHPNIAQTYDLDVDRGELFLAMEFVPGATLLEAVKACRDSGERLPVGFILAAVRDTALALHYAHTFSDPTGRPRSVIHRDIAEKNIMVTYDGATKLLDFGVAKAADRFTRTAVSSVKGSIGYMAPEQLSGLPVDARSDIFSLGVVLHQCLTGVRLFYAPKPEDELLAPIKQEARPPSRRNPDVSPELDAVVLKALAKQPDQRYPTALAFARGIEEAVGHLLWKSEQSGELMQRLFEHRRTQTRAFYASSAGTDTTGEFALEKLVPKSAPRTATPQEVPALLTPPPPPLAALKSLLPPKRKARPEPAPRAKEDFEDDEPKTVLQDYPWSTPARTPEPRRLERSEPPEPEVLPSKEFTLLPEEPEEPSRATIAAAVPAAAPRRATTRSVERRPPEASSHWEVILSFMVGMALCALLLTAWRML